MKNAVFTTFVAHVPCGDLTKALIHLKEIAEDADAIVFTTHDCPEDGFPYELKAEFLKVICANYGVTFMESDAKTIFHILHHLWQNGYTDVTGIYGEGYDEAIRGTSFNGVKLSDPKLNDKLFYKFDGLKIERDDQIDEGSIETAQLLVFADEGDEGGFLNACSLDGETAKDLYAALRAQKRLSHRSIVDPNKRAYNQLAQQRVDLDFKRDEEPELGLQTSMGLHDPDLEDKLSLVSEWMAEQRTNPFIG
jgi:hypothetical protein